MSGETATALVSLSRAMGRRETRIIRRGNSSTSLSLKVLNEQILFVFNKLFCKTNFSRNMNILTIKINWWRFECKLKLLKLETIVLLFFPRKDWNFTLFLSILRSKIKISRYNLWFESEQDPMVQVQAAQVAEQRHNHVQSTLTTVAQIPGSESTNNKHSK